VGVGAAIADIIAKLHKTGTHAGLEAMRKDIPAGVLELLSVPGLRPEKVLKLYSELGMASAICIAPRPSSKPPKRICGGRTPASHAFTPAGDFRRSCELVSSLSLVAEVPKLGGGKTIRVSEQLTIHLVEKNRYGITLLRST
jgi:DNA polymerase (family 10)